jgi:hypothetical protein
VLYIYDIVVVRAHPREPFGRILFCITQLITKFADYLGHKFITNTYRWIVKSRRWVRNFMQVMDTVRHVFAYLRLP